VEKFRQIFEAYETLRDPLRRATYDDSLRVPIVRRQTIVEPLCPEPTRAQRLGPDLFTGRDIIEELLSELFDELHSDPFLNRPFSRW